MKWWNRAGAIAAVTLVCLAGPALGQGRPSGPERGRYVTVGAEPVNLRKGPGTGHAVIVELAGEGRPLRILGERGKWLHVRDHEGREGWVWRDLINYVPWVVFLRDTPMRPDPDLASKPSGTASKDSFARVYGCSDGPTCLVARDGKEFWVLRKDTWGVDPTVIIQ